MNDKDLEKIKIIVSDVINSAVKDFPTRKEVEDIVENIVENKIESLAQITARGFEEVDKKFEEVAKGFKEINKRFETVEADIREIKEDVNYIGASLRETKITVSEMEENFIYRHEHEDLESRVKLCETKLNIKSGR